MSCLLTTSQTNLSNIFINSLKVLNILPTNDWKENSESYLSMNLKTAQLLKLHLQMELIKISTEKETYQLLFLKNILRRNSLESIRKDQQFRKLI